MRQYYLFQDSHALLGDLRPLSSGDLEVNVTVLWTSTQEGMHSRLEKVGEI